MITFDKYGYASEPLPPGCVDDCSHAGQCDDDVDLWREALDFTVDRQQAIDYLRETGAWTLAELQGESDQVLANRVLWIGACDTAEQGEWAGMVH